MCLLFLFCELRLSAMTTSSSVDDIPFLINIKEISEYDFDLVTMDLLHINERTTCLMCGSPVIGLYF